MVETTRFDFLSKDFPELYANCLQAANMTDCTAATKQMRHILEYLLAQLQRPVTKEKSLVHRTRELREECILDDHLYALFHLIRKTSNDIVVSEEEKSTALNSLVDICIWYAVKYHNKPYSLSAFTAKDEELAQRYILKDEWDQQGFHNPFSSTRNEVAEADELCKKGYETTDDYKNRIEKLPSVCIGSAIMNPLKVDVYTKMQHLEHHIKSSIDIAFDDSVCFYLDDDAYDETIAGNLFIRRIVIDDQCQWDYNRIFLRTETKDIPVKFVFWKQLETENSEKFAARVRSLPYVALAECEPVDIEYDMKRQMLPFKVWPLQYAGALNLGERIEVNCTKERAKYICEHCRKNLYVYGKVNADLSLSEFVIWNDNTGVLFCTAKNKDEKIKNFKQQAAAAESREMKLLGYEQAAKLGDVEAVSKLGVEYYTAHEYDKAFLWLERAAQHNYAEAQKYLGDCYRYGLIVDADGEDAVYWYSKAAEQGFADAQNTLADCYNNGWGTACDADMAIHWYTKAAEQDHADAQNSLGLCYYEKNDEDRAIKWFTKAAEQGHADAQNNLAKCYYSNVAYDEAYKWFAKAAEQGHADAQNRLGICYGCGHGVAVDYAKAAEYYALAAEQGHSIAQNNLGHCYYHGEGVAIDYEKAAAWYAKAAQQGHIQAQNSLGDCYYYGDGVEENTAEAVFWFSKAAEQGYSTAQYNLASCYYHGDGIEQDYVQAAAWFAKAAEQGHAKAQNNLGSCYYNGDGVAKDYEKAVYWYQKAAAQDWADAQNNLADCYYNEEGVARDYDKAAQLYTQAAEQGHADTQNNLAMCYEEEQGVARDYKKAVYWYTKAAEQGHIKAQFNLANCYYYGQGVDQDYSKAVHWYELAANQGHEQAQLNLERCYKEGKVGDSKAMALYKKVTGQGPSLAKEQISKFKKLGSSLLDFNKK